MYLSIHFEYFFRLSSGEKIHDLTGLLNFNVSKVVGETLGAQLVHQHQELHQEHWGSA